MTTAHAVPLFTIDGTPAGVWYCSACKYVGPSEAVAKTCCAPKVCEDCGAEYERRWVYPVCKACHAVRHTKRLQEAWDKAPKHKGTWYGPVVTDDCEGPNDGFWSSLGDLYDWLEDEDIAVENVRAYTTIKVPMSADATSIIEGMCEEMHEEAYDEIPVEAHQELQDMLDDWVAKWGTVTYVQSKTAIVI